MKQADEGVRNGRVVSPGIELMSECIEGIWIVAEVGNVKHRFSEWEIQSSKISIETGIGGTKVGDASRGADTRASLQRSVTIPVAQTQAHPP